MEFNKFEFKINKGIHKKYNFKQLIYMLTLYI